jgi:tripeptide aminopeptidase
MLREGSTDFNVAMNMGILAITISGGGNGTGAHPLGEAFDAKDSWVGMQRGILLAVAGKIAFASFPRGMGSASGLSA